MEPLDTSITGAAGLNQSLQRRIEEQQARQAMLEAAVGGWDSSLKYKFDASGPSLQGGSNGYRRYAGNPLR